MGVVYVVTSGEYSDYHIDGVFSDYDKAELYCAFLTDKGDYSCENPHIEEYDQDIIQVEGKIYRGVSFREVQGIGSKYIDCIHTFVSMKPIEQKVKNHIRGDGIKVLLVTIPISNRVNDDEAEKIAYDWLAKYKAEGQGL
jgi:hypothetical protein